METAVVGLPGPRPAREEPLAGASGGEREDLGRVRRSGRPFKRFEAMAWDG